MRWTSSTIGLVAVVALIGLGLAVDAVGPDASVPTPTPAVVGPARSGAATCAVVGATADASSTVVATALPAGAGAGEALDTSDVTVDVVAEGITLVAATAEVPPGAGTAVAVPAGAGSPLVAARWFDVPTTVHRSTVRSGEEGAAGRLEGPCPAEVSDRWIVPGLATAGGATARLVLANPYASDASVSVAFTTPQGTVRPRLLENVVVPAGAVRTVEVNEHAPEQPDLGALVSTRSGRAVVEAVQEFDAAIGGVEGIALAPAVAAPAETWTIPWFTDGAAQLSWLWLTNPDDRPAAVTLTLHTTEGGLVPEGIEELTLAPGSTQRVDLRGLLGEGGGSGAVTVRTDNGVGIVASVASQILDEEDAARTGVGIGIGATEPSATWVAAGGPTEGRDLSLTLVNPAAEPAVVDVAVWTPGGVSRPQVLQGLSVGAGAYLAASLTDVLPETEAYALVVTAREGRVVAGTVGLARSGSLAFAVSTAASGSALEGGGTVSPVLRVPGLTQRLGTQLGPQVADPFARREQSAVPAPTDTDPVELDDPLGGTGPDPTDPDPTDPATGPDGAGEDPDG
ncbi:MAG: DUF5719 family protein [Actinomycetes bacterium]